MFDSVATSQQPGVKGEDDVIPNVPIDHLDYGYIESCNSVDELKDILKVLESGKEGRWYQLEKACENKLLELLPAKEKRLYLAMRTEPSHDQVQEASSELNNFLQDIRSMDERLKKNKVKQPDESKTAIFDNSENIPSQNQVFPPVRGSSDLKAKPQHNIHTRTEEEIKRDEERKSERISGYDFRAWDQFDVDKELEMLDKKEQEEEMKKRKILEEKQKQIDERKELQSKSMPKHVDPTKLLALSREQRIFFSNREKEKGNESFKACEFEDAYTFYTKSIEFMPEDEKDPRPFANRAMTSLKLERWEQAENDCSLALKLDPEFTKAYTRRGMARHRRGKYLDAIDDFEQALFREPNNTKLNGMLAESRKMYNQVGGIGADKPGAPPRKQDQKKKETFKKLMILEDDSDSSSDEEEEEEEEDKEDAFNKDNNEKEEQIATSSEETSITWIEAKRNGATEFKNGNYKIALNWFDTAVSKLQGTEQVEDLVNCMGNIAVCHRETKEWDKVVEICNKILEINGSNVKALFRRAIAFEEMENFTAALDDMCAVLRIDPDHTQAGERIAFLMDALQTRPPKPPSVKQNKVDVVEKKIEQQPKKIMEPQVEETAKTFDIDHTKEQGNQMFLQGNFSGALEAYNKCLDMDKQNISVIANRAMVYLKLNEYEKCIADCTSGLSLGGDIPQTSKVKLHYRRAMGYKSIKKINLALEDLKVVLKLEPQNKRALKERDDLEKVYKQDIEKTRMLERKAEQSKIDELTEKAKLKAKEKIESAKSFAVPKTNYEFQRTWRPLSSEQRSKYLLSIPENKIKQIFKVEIPDDTLIEIIMVFKENAKCVEKTQIVRILNELASLKPFKTTLSFLSKSQKDIINDFIPTLNDAKLTKLYTTNL